VLELACGPGTPTGMLAERAARRDGIDRAPEMLELAAGPAPGANVRFERADLFSWRLAARLQLLGWGFAMHDQRPVLLGRTRAVEAQDSPSK
jgi:trans-aconitate methyltransferase